MAEYNLKKDLEKIEVKQSICIVYHGSNKTKIIAGYFAGVTGRSIFLSQNKDVHNSAFVLGKSRAYALHRVKKIITSPKDISCLFGESESADKKNILEQRNLTLY